MTPLEHVPHPVASIVRHIDTGERYLVHDISGDGKYYDLYGCEALGTDKQIWEGASYHLVALVSPPSLENWNRLIAIREVVEYMEDHLWQY